jgi:hypothetical protein
MPPGCGRPVGQPADDSVRAGIGGWGQRRLGSGLEWPSDGVRSRVWPSGHRAIGPSGHRAIGDRSAGGPSTRSRRIDRGQPIDRGQVRRHSTAPPSRHPVGPSSSRPLRTYLHGTCPLQRGGKRTCPSPEVEGRQRTCPSPDAARPGRQRTCPSPDAARPGISPEPRPVPTPALCPHPAADLSPSRRRADLPHPAADLSPSRRRADLSPHHGRPAQATADLSPPQAKGGPVPHGTSGPPLLTTHDQQEVRGGPTSTTATRQATP